MAEQNNSADSGTKPGDLQQQGLSEKHEQGRPAAEEICGSARARLTQLLIVDVLREWEKHGEDSLQKMREDRPLDFVKLASGLALRSEDVKGDRLDELDDEQLAGELGAVLARLAAAGAHPGEQGGAPGAG